MDKHFDEFAINGDIDNLKIAVNVGNNSTNWLRRQRGDPDDDDDDDDGDELVALHRSAENGHLECVEVLLNCGADIHSKTSWYEKTPLNLAAKNGHLSIVEMLIERGADINMDTRIYDIELGCFGKAIAYAAFSDHDDIVSFLHGKGSRGLEDALNAATSNGSMYSMNFLLDVGADVNSKDRSELTPLCTAACFNEPDCALELIIRGADVNLMCRDDESPLMRAAQNGNMDVCRLLLDNQADIDDSIAKYTKRQNFPGYDCVPMILKEMADRRKRELLDSFVAYYIEYHPYKNTIYSICYSDGNIQIAAPLVGWTRAEAVRNKYFFDEIFFYLNFHVGKVTTNSASDRYSSIIALSRNSNACSTLMIVLVDRLKLYLEPPTLTEI